MERFVLKRMYTSVKNKLQMCWVTQHQCIRCQMCGKCSHINSLHSHWTVTKNDLSSLNNLFMANFQLMRMSSCSKNELQMSSVTQHQCRCRQMCGKCSQFTKFTHFLSVTKTDLSWLNNLFMERFLLNRMSTSVENKLRMCWVIQHQCRRRQMFGNCLQIQPVHSLFVRYKKRLVLIEQSIHGRVSTH